MSARGGDTATTNSYLLLILAIVAGLATTLVGSGLIGEAHNYRESVSVGFRSLFVLQPDGAPVASAPLSFQIHATIAMVHFAIWPFTRLVHTFSAPVGYQFRPYIVYRSRTAARPGEPIGPDHDDAAGQRVVDPPSDDLSP